MAGGVPRLDRLPAELTGLVAGELDAGSLGVLRLVSHHINASFTPWFLKHVSRSQTTEFTLYGIRRLQFLSLSELLKSVVNTIRFVSPHYHRTPANVGAGTTSPGDLYTRRRDVIGLEPIEFLKTRDDQAWLEHRILEQSNLNRNLPAVVTLLTEVFRNFKTIDGICLEATVVLGPEYSWPPEQVEHLDWRPMWGQNITAFRTIVASISESQIQLERLELFPNTALCSIPVNELSITKMEGFEKMASCLGHFSVSLSTAVREPFYSEPTLARNPGMVQPESDVAITRSEVKGMSDVARLIQAMKGLETLHIHFYQTCWFNNAPTPCVEMLEKAFKSAQADFRHLTHLSLLCVPITSTTIGSILERCPQLRSLSLRLLQLDQDSWVETLTPLVSSSVRSASLSSLFVADYRPGFRVLQENMMRDVDTLCARNPAVERVIQSREAPVEAEVSGPPSREKRQSLVLEVEPQVFRYLGADSVQSRRLMMLQQRLCGPPCRQGQYLFGGRT